MTKPRAPKTAWRFYEKRHGDTITVPDKKARVYALSAFANWKRNRPGTLKARSEQIEGGYRITFEGISPAEVNRAYLSADKQEDI